jgi:hypothetical protein
MAYRFSQQHQVPDVSKRESWLNIRYIPLLPIGEGNLEVDIQRCKETGHKGTPFQKCAFQYESHLYLR